MASVTYYTTASQPLFTAPQPIGLPVWENPYPDQIATKGPYLFRQKFMVRGDYYSGTDLNTTYRYATAYLGPVVSNRAASFYLVEEANFADVGGGLLEFERTYAQVLDPRTEYTSMAYHYPAIVTAYTAGAYSAVTNPQPAGASMMFINFTGAYPGELVSLSYSNAGVSYVSNVFVRDYASGGIFVDINGTFISSTYSKAAARVNRASGRAEPVDLVGRASIMFDYALSSPGAVPSFASYATRQKFTLNGVEVDFVSADTVPTSASYAASVSSGGSITAEDATWEKWLGNIYVKKTTSVLAQ